MSQDVSVNSMIAVIDVYQNAVDFSALSDYLKTNYKKEVVLLNAQDFLDAGSRIAKTENKLNSKGKSTSGGNTTAGSSFYGKKNLIIDPQSQSIAKGIKAKIDSDLAKVLDMKKKTYATFEKEKMKALSKSAKNNEEKANALKSKVQVDFEELKMSLPFEGKIDILYIVVNFPYLPHQLARLLESGVDLNVFLTIVPKDFEEITNQESQNANEEENGTLQKPTNEKNQSNQGKKSSIAGQELDSIQNSNYYPPLRWTSLRESSPPYVVYENVFCGDNIEGTFKNIEEKLILITKARESYNDFFKEKTLIELPIANYHQNLKLHGNDFSYLMNNFIEFLSERQGDFINALYYELKSHLFHTIRSPPPMPISDQFDNIFKNAMDTLNRTVVFLEPKELNSSDFSFDFPTSIQSLIYRLQKWSIKKEFVGACQALSCFLNSPQNFYAYSGSKFDLLVQSTNKKYQLNLPLSYFDWSQWTYISQHLHLDESLVERIRKCDIIETIYDEAIGILWVLGLQPIPKTIGQYQSKYFMPQTIDGITEYIDRIYNNSNENNGNQPEKKTRNLPSPAQLIRDSLDFNILLPSLIQRMNENDSYYKLPIKVSNSIHFNSPYYFESGLKVNINREIINEKMSFNYTANFKHYFDLFTNKLSIIVQTFEGIRIMFEKPFSVTILFNEQSICYNSESFVIKSTGEFPIMITKNGAFIMNDKDGIKTIVHPNGTITRSVIIDTPPDETSSRVVETKSINKQSSVIINNNVNSSKPTKTMAWRSIDKDGVSYLHTPDGQMIKEDLKHGEVVDFASMTRSIIRPDNIEYYIKKDGTRKIIFGLDFSIEQSVSNLIDKAFDQTPVKSSLKEGSKLNKGKSNLDEINSDILNNLNENAFVFDIPNFPVIEMKGNEMSMSLDRFLFNFSENCVKMVCPDYAIAIDPENMIISAPPPSEETEAVAISESLSLSISQMNQLSNNVTSKEFPEFSKDDDFITTMCLNQNRCEFRCNDKILVADANGIEKMCQLEESISQITEVPPTNKKKKADSSITTHWGKANPIKETITEQQQLDLYKLFVPHFYAIRANMSYCEFLRKDSINSEGCTTFEDVISHPSGIDCNIISYHHHIKQPAIYLVNKSLTKAERSTLLKGLHIPKPKKEKPKKEKPQAKPPAPPPETVSVSNSVLSNADLNETSSKEHHKRTNSSSKKTKSSHKIKSVNSEVFPDIQEPAGEQPKNKSRSKSRAQVEKSDSTNKIQDEPQTLIQESSRLIAENEIDNDNSQDDEAFSLAEANHNTFFGDIKLFISYTNGCLEKNNVSFELMNRPPEVPEPEILPMPPQTPSPRLLESQANKYSKTVEEFQSGSADPNYWESFEAEFAMPVEEPRTIERDLSPRTKLFDPPRPFKQKKKSYYYQNDAQNTSDEDSNLDFYDEESYNNLDSNYVPENDLKYVEPVKPKASNNSVSNSYNSKATKRIIYKNKIVKCPNSRCSFNPASIVSRPVTVKTMPNTINFGQVKANTSAFAQLVITNTGKSPLHYSVTQTTDPNIKVLTIPGVVLPGLKMTLKVELLPIKYPQTLETSFQLKTQLFDLSIPVTAEIVYES